MANMDHNEAIQLQAAVKYVLGELSQIQREEYEEHYFECAECAIDLKALATFADTTRQVWRQEKANQLASDSVPALGGWPTLVPLKPSWSCLSLASIPISVSRILAFCFLLCFLHPAISNF